jgi:hypothetical protein
MIAAKSVPLNPNDPLYKEGTGGKVGRGFGAAARGFLEHGVPGAVAGAAVPASVGTTPYSAPNQDYQIDDRARQAQLGLAEKQKADAMAKFKQAVDLRKQADTGAKDAGTMANTTADIPIRQQTVDAETMKANQAGQPKNEQEALSKAYTTEDPKEAQKYFAMAKAMHSATMEEKPPRAPGDHPSEGLVRYEDLKRAAVRENNGKPLNSAQLAKLSTDLSMSQKPEGAIAPALADKIKARKDTAMRAAQTALTTGFDSKSEEYTKERFVNDMNQAQQAYETSIEDGGGTVNHMEMGDDLKWNQDATNAPVTPSAAAPAANATPPKLGKDGSFAGMAKIQAGEVAVIDRNGTPRYMPKARLAEALRAGWKRAQ